jgi:hypothetical protein
LRRQTCALIDMKLAIADSPEPITDYMRPSSTTDIEVRKPLVRATTWLKLASIAGLPITGGGMKTSIAGTPSATGATKITNTITNVHDRFPYWAIACQRKTSA